MRGHPSGGLSMGRVFSVVISTKQKLNTQNLTETGVVGVYDCITYVLWTRYWLDSKGYDVLEKKSSWTIKLLFFWVMARL